MPKLLRAKVSIMGFSNSGPASETALTDLCLNSSTHHYVVHTPPFCASGPSTAEVLQKEQAAVSEISVLCYSVGGPANYRNLRALLMKQCVPGVTSHQLATTEPGPNWVIPAVPLVSTMGGTFAPAKKYGGARIFPALEFRDSATVAKHITCEEGDAVLIVGKTNVGFGRDSDPTEFLNTLCGEKSVPIWVMGGDSKSFNFSTADVTGLTKRGFTDVTLVSDKDCPSFTAAQWQDLFKTTYPAALTKLNSLAIGGFFATRIPFLVRRNGEDDYFTDAFTRQFNLRELCQQTDGIRKFEISVAEELHKKCNTVASNNILEAVLLIPMGASTETAFTTAIAAYQANPLGPEVPVLDTILRPKINPPKEYDGFTAYSMIRAMAELSAPTAKELFLALKQGVPTAVVKAFHRKSGVKRVHVVHDLGLDPQSDDYNAVRLLKSLNEVPPPSGIFL